MAAAGGVQPFTGHSGRGVDVAACTLEVYTVAIIHGLQCHTECADVVRRQVILGITAGKVGMGTEVCQNHSFAALTGESGYAIANADDENVKIALSNYSGNIITFGIENKSATLCALNIEKINGLYSFDIVYEGNLVCRANLGVSGYHNIYNALACAAAALVCGLSGEDIAHGLASFRGAARRMEYKGRLGGAAVYDDYGHHPTEVLTTLKGAKSLCRDGGRLLCAFQSHTYTRTKEFLDEFVSALSVADRVYSVDIYSAREKDDLGVSAKLIAELIGEKAVHCPTFSDTAETIAREARSGDVVVVMGAGDIYKVFDFLADKFEK